MSEDESGKTEEPTDHKLKKAREEGNVPKSEDLNGFMGLLFAVIIGGLMTLLYPERISDELGKCFQTVWGFAIKKYDVTPDCLTFARTMMEMAYLMFGGMITAAFLGYFIMNKGFVIAKEPIKFNIQALDIGTNLKNMVSKENAVGMCLSIVKETLFYSIFFLIFIFFLPPMVFETFCFLNCEGNTPFYYIMSLILVYTFISFLFAAIDYPLKIRFWKDKLKMSHKDIKDEHKEIEGSPEVKQAQREFRHEMLEGTPMGPKNATFFVSDGSTVWGIRYNKDESPAPVLVAVGKDPKKAGKIMQVASRIRRLIINDDEFVKLLNGKGVMGRPVPLEYVANVRKCIMELRKHEAEFGPTHPQKN